MSVWQTTILLSKIFFLVFLSQPLFGAEARLQDGPRIDFVRQDEAGPLHLGLRCSRGLAADTTLRCEVRRIMNGNVILKGLIPEERLRESLAVFFKSVPATELKSQNGPIPTIKGSSLHWKIVDGNKYVIGGFPVGAPDPKTAEAQEKFERAILVLEIELEAALHRQLAASLGK